MNDLQNTSHLQSFTLLRNNMPQFVGGGKFNFFSRRETTNSFMSIITQKGFHHSLIFTFLLLFCCVGNIKAQNEPLCTKPTACNDLKIEMIRMENALASCAPDGCADRFRQVAFKVYLKYTLPSAPSQALVALDYQYLRVKTFLKVIPQIAGSPTYSMLNVNATQACFKNEHLNWVSFSSSNGDKALLETNGAANEVGIDFFSDPNNTSALCGNNSSGIGSNQIIFNFAVPPPIGSGSTTGTPGVAIASCIANPNLPVPMMGTCAYVELFTVIVDAFPNEEIRLGSSLREYSSKSSPVLACDNPPIGSGLGLITSGNFNALFGITAPPPVTYTGTQNEQIQVEITDPTPSGNAQGVTVQLRNIGNVPITPTYVEFMVNATILNLDVPPVFGANIPRVVDLGNGVKMYHYKVQYDPQSIAPGGTLKVGTITYGPATIQNLGWSVTLSLNFENNKFRIKTMDQSCTNLKVKTTDIVVAQSGANTCNNPDLRFSAKVSNTFTCGTYNLRVALTNVNLNANYQVAGFSTKLVLSTNGNIQVLNPTIAGFTNWPWPTSVNACPFSCGGNTNYCVVGTNEFNYCFQITNINDKKSLTGGSTIYIDVPISYIGNSCITNITIKELSISLISLVGNTGVILTGCVPSIDYAASGYTVCPASGSAESISGLIRTEPDEGIEDVTVTITPTCNPSIPSSSILSTATGSYGFCNLPPTCSAYNIVPTLALDPLNGVNTWDLILISRHILGLEPLNSPYKLISADANKSGTVTTFDIVELRKLILGTYQQLPANSSWRFVDKAQVFTNPANPFADVIRENIDVLSSFLPQNDTYFTGCKIGDVDQTATPNNKSARPETNLSWSGTVAAKGGAIVSVPVIYQGSEPMDGLQFALHFDPQVWELIGPSAGDVVGVQPNNFGLSKLEEGIIGFSWNVFEGESMAAQPGVVLFFLSFKAKGDIPEQATIFDLDYNTIQDGGWTHDGTEHHLIATPIAAERQVSSSTAPVNTLVKVVPNPTSGMTTLYFNSSVAGKTRLVLADAFGQQLTLSDISTGIGQQSIAVHDLIGKPAGVYTWWIKMPDGTMAQGRIVKQ